MRKRFQLAYWIVLCSGSFSLLAQAPTDEWRRGGLDAMVAEPGQASSILSNPAGIKTNEQRYPLWYKGKKPGKKYEWITEVLSADIYLTQDTWSLLSNGPLSLVGKLEEQLSIIPSAVQLLSGNEASDPAAFNLIKGLTAGAYGGLREGISSLPADNNDLKQDHLKNLSDSDFGRIAKNLQDKSIVRNALSDSLIRLLFSNLGNLGFEHFSRFFSLSHVNDKRPLAWGFYFGFEQKALLHTNVKGISMPVDFDASYDDRATNFKVNIPIGLQAYLVFPFRVAFAHNFGQALPGFTFGLGVKVVPFLGLNQKDLGHIVSQSASDAGSGSKYLQQGLGKFTGLNIGLDFGVQYHFGAITPKLEFLHTGLKISDIIGFTIPPFVDEGRKVRYATDFDWGLYAEYQFPKIAQLFGGFEIIQIRGFLGDTNPYSALLNPLDHLRFVAGVGLFSNVLRLTLQYYNSTFTPSIMLNIATVQLHFAVNLNTAAAESWGAEFTFRFRGPHNGFNKKTPYKTYAQLAKEKTGTQKNASSKKAAK